MQVNYSSGNTMVTPRKQADIDAQRGIVYSKAEWQRRGSPSRRYEVYLKQVRRVQRKLAIRRAIRIQRGAITPRERIELREPEELRFIK